MPRPHEERRRAQEGESNGVGGRLATVENPEAIPRISGRIPYRAFESFRLDHYWVPSRGPTGIRRDAKAEGPSGMTPMLWRTIIQTYPDFLWEKDWMSIGVGYWNVIVLKNPRPLLTNPSIPIINPFR